MLTVTRLCQRDYKITRDPLTITKVPSYFIKKGLLLTIPAGTVQLFRDNQLTEYVGWSGL